MLVLDPSFLNDFNGDIIEEEIIITNDGIRVISDIEDGEIWSSGTYFINGSVNVPPGGLTINMDNNIIFTSYNDEVDVEFINGHS